ncbi:MAG: GGDEF domain-containing protein, partial [Trueperaceae bacterium]|nr:GGDEF domain-containing protein [Trueperaceae bacterium]
TPADALARIDALQREGRLGEVLAAVDAALHAADAAGDRAMAAQVPVRQGIALDAAAEFDAAGEALRRAATTFEELGDDEALASALNSLGVVRSRAGDALAGLAYYTRVRQLRERLGDAGGVLQALNNAAINLKNLGRLAEALATSDEALALADAEGDDAARTVVLANRAVLLAKLGRAEALATFEAAEAGARRHGYPLYLSETLRRHAEVLLERGRVAEAATKLDEAVDVAAGMGAREQLQAAWQLRSACFEARGDAPAALADLKRAHALAIELADERLRSRLDARQDRFDRELALRTSDESRRRHADLQRAHQELERLHVRLAEQTTLLEARSRTDHLTGLANRAHLDERLRDEVRRAARYGTALTLLMVDLDHFKQVNDRFAHVVGDQVLRAVAGVLRDHVRASDLVARYGGEEFAVVLPETDLTAALSAVTKLAGALAAHPWRVLHPDLPDVTLSAGVASTDQGLAADALLAVADARLLVAKRLGRAQVVTGDDADGAPLFAPSAADAPR